jgi:hypothetical protein
MSKPRMAVICFLPDTGHVLPLLRLARLVRRQAPVEVVCYVQDKFEERVREYGFEHRGLPGIEPPSDSGTLSALSRRSVFYNAFSSYCDLRDHDWTPLRDAVSRGLGALAESLRAQEPRLVVCDSHLFLDYYLRLAACCGARLIANRADGSLARFRRLSVQTYGLREGRRWVSLAVEAAGWMAKRFHKARRLLCHPERRRLTRASLAAAERRARSALADCPAEAPDPLYVTAGLGVLEPGYDAIRRGTAARNELFLPPTAEAAATGLPAGLGEWLAAQDDGRVVYVSFGTMIALFEKFLDELVEGLVCSGAPVVWSLPRAQHGLLAKYDLGGRFRIEAFVPQLAVLASHKVGCFVTHGGSGSAQDAVIAGKPVLCVPFMWDQPYNSSVLEWLGVAKVLAKRKVKAARVRRAVRELLDNPAYRRTALRLADTVRDLRRGSQLSAIPRIRTPAMAQGAATGSANTTRSWKCHERESSPGEHRHAGL